MLTYRGDKFVIGKKFIINEEKYRFCKRNNEQLIFESVKDGSKLTMTEEKYNELEKVLTEKINQENKEVNEIIGKALRSKTVARKYEDLLKSKGIEVDYSQPQGVTLIGPNGKKLDASSKEVHGPAKPGHNSTHKEPDSWNKERAKDYTGYTKDYEDKLADLKSLKRDDIIRKYPTLSSKEALKKHKDEIKYTEDKIKDYKSDAADYANSYKHDVERSKRFKRAGHQLAARYTDLYQGKVRADKNVDYLNYLTKTYYEKPGANDYWRQEFVAGDSKQGEDEWGSKYNYFGKNGYPGKRNANLKKYDELKQDIERAKEDVDFATYDDNDSYNSSYAAMTDEQLENKIQKMRDALEKEIEELKAKNEKNKGQQSAEIKELQAKEKELDNFLKSKGIREAVLTIINGRKLNESYENVKNDSAEYINTSINNIYDEILTLAQEAQYYGFNEISDKLNDILGILDYIQVK